MKYAIRYRKDFRHFDQVDEVIFTVKKGDGSITSFIPTIVKEDWQKVTLEMATEKPLEEILPFVIQLQEVHPNILVQLPWPLDDTEVSLLKDNNIPFMGNVFCKDFETIYTLKRYGVSEIYVVEALGFRLDEVKRITGDDIKIRVIPNVTQCAYGTRRKLSTEHKFWIRPEDTRFYESYVDTFELFNEDDRLSVVYEVYKNKVWKGDISEIILDADDLTIANSSIPPYFGDQRVNCKQRCLYNTCAACEANLQFARTFSKTEMEIVYPKEKKNEFKMAEEAV